MQEIEYIFYLTAEQQDRLRVYAVKHEGKILEFVVQYEAFLADKWNPIIRYDTAHGFAHIDRIYPDGQIEKQPLYFDNYNLAFTYATIDIKRFWKKYREEYEERIRGC